MCSLMNCFFMSHRFNSEKSIMKVIFFFIGTTLIIPGGMSGLHSLLRTRMRQARPSSTMKNKSRSKVRTKCLPVMHALTICTLPTI